MIKYNRLLAGCCLAGMLILSGCGGDSDSAAEETPAPPATENPAPPPADTSSAAVRHETAVTTTTGERIGIKVTTEGFIAAGFEGKPMVLEFYGDTCPHCLEAIPAYNTLQQKYGDRALILTIDDGNQYTTLDNAGLQAFVSAHGIGYRTVSRENAGNLKAYAEELVGSMPGVPYVIIVNKDGVITARMLGPTSAQLEAALLDVL